MGHNDTKRILREAIIKEGKNKLKKLLKNEGFGERDIERIIKRIIALLEQGQDNRLKSFLMGDLDLDGEKANRLVDEITNEYLKWDPILSF